MKVTRLKKQVIYFSGFFWDDDFSCWQRSPAFACRYASSHHEAGDWMMKEITTAGSEAHDAGYFKNGTLEILI